MTKAKDEIDEEVKGEVEQKRSDPEGKAIIMPTQDQPLEVTELLAKIENLKRDNEDFERLKNKAFTEAQKPEYRNISNHQVGRLKHILMDIKKDDPEPWYEYLVNITHKSKLHEKLLVSLDLRGLDKNDEFPVFEDYKAFWKQVFIYLRKKAKRSK